MTTESNMKGKTVRVRVVGLSKNEAFKVKDVEYLGCPTCRSVWDDNEMGKYLGKTYIVEMDILNDTDTDFVGAQIGDEAYNICVHALEVVEIIKSVDDMFNEFSAEMDKTYLNYTIELIKTIISGLRDRMDEAEEAGKKGIMDRFECDHFKQGIQVGINDLQMNLRYIEERKQRVESRTNGKK